MAFGPLSKEDLLELWRRLFEPGYTVPIEQEAGGQGLDVYAQQAAQFARVAEAANRTAQAYYLKPHSDQTEEPAAGAAKATGSVQISRVAPAVGPITVGQGVALESVQVGATGEEAAGSGFVLTADAVLPGGSLGPVTVAIEAERVGYQGNVPADRITRFRTRGTASIPSATVEPGNVLRDSGVPDRLAPSMVDQYVRFVTGANVATFPRRILSVTQGDATSTAILDGPALISPDTADVAVLEFADLGLSVSQPAATSGGRHGWLDAIGLDRRTARQLAEGDTSYRDRICALEDIISPAAVRRAASRVLSPLGIAFELKEVRDGAGFPGMVSDWSPLDYGDIPDGFSLLPETRFFVLCVGIGNQGEFGAPSDSPHPSNAADWLFLDGFPVEYNAAIGALWDAVDRARAAGVGFVIVQDPSL